MSDTIEELKRSLIARMTRYTKYGLAESKEDPRYDPGHESGYSVDDVRACEMILERYLVEVQLISEPNQHVRIRQLVQIMVLALNELNQSCNDSLIETSEREDICDIFNQAAAAAGYDVGEEDITEAWRDW